MTVVAHAHRLSRTNAELFSLTKTQAHTFYWQKVTASYSSTRDVSVVSTNRSAAKFTGTFSSFFLSLKVLHHHRLHLDFTHREGDVASVSSTVYKPSLLSLTSHYSRSTLTIHNASLLELYPISTFFAMNKRIVNANRLQVSEQVDSVQREFKQRDFFRRLSNPLRQVDVHCYNDKHSHFSK